MLRPLVLLAMIYGVFECLRLSTRNAEQIVRIAVSDIHASERGESASPSITPGLIAHGLMMRGGETGLEGFVPIAIGRCEISAAVRFDPFRSDFLAIRCIGRFRKRGERNDREYYDKERVPDAWEFHRRAPLIEVNQQRYSCSVEAERIENQISHAVSNSHMNLQTNSNSVQ